MTTTWVLVGAGACLLLALVAVLVVAGGRRRVTSDVESTRRRLERSEQEVAELRQRLAALTVRTERAEQAAARLDRSGAEYVITNAGQVGRTDQADLTRHADDEDRRPEVSQVVLAPALAEPLVKIVAFAYGVGRALSGQNRHRIRYEVRAATRRARKVRRRDTREARRRLLAERRSEAAAASRADHEVRHESRQESSHEDRGAA